MGNNENNEIRNSTEKGKGWWDKAKNKSGESQRKYRRTLLVVYALLGGFFAYYGYEYAYDKLIHDGSGEKYARLLSIAVVLLALLVSSYLWYLRNRAKLESLAEAKRSNQFNSYSIALKLFLTEDKPTEKLTEKPTEKLTEKLRGQTSREVGLLLLMRLKNEEKLYGEEIDLVTPYKDLTGAYLPSADLTKANLTGANLTEADLTKADLTEAKLQDADLTEADLRGADLEGVELTGAALERANLVGADLEGANLTGANLIEADLSGAYLIEAGLMEANFWGADLTRAILFAAELIKVNLTKANLRGADLSEADLTGANLQEANLVGAILEGAKLLEANLTGVNLTGADLNKAKLLINEENLTKTLSREELESMLKNNYQDIHDPKTAELKSGLVEVKIVAAEDKKTYSLKKLNNKIQT